MNLRELVAGALQSSHLEQSAIREAAIDRIGGLAFSDPLGCELWRLMAYQANAYERVLGLLGKRARNVIAVRTMRRKVCVAVTAEFIDQACRTCGGIGYLLATSTSAKRLCPTCEGTRQRRYSDLWRARQLGVDVEAYPRWDRRYSVVSGLLADADRLTFRELSLQLERVLPKSALYALEIQRRRATLRESASPTFTQEQQQGAPFAVSTATL